MNLSQRKLFLQKELTLKQESLHVKFKDLTSSEELNIPYEEIDTSKLILQKQTDNIMLIVTLVFGTFFLINIFNPDNYKEDGLLGVAVVLFFVTAISGMITYIKSKKVALIPTQNNGYLEIFNNKPNKEEFDNFIDELSNKITLFLKTKYGKIDLDMPTEPQLINLAWLRDREVISMEEFESLKSNLINKTNSNNPVGFNK